MKHLITKAEAQVVLAPYHDTIFDVVDVAWDRWRKKLSSEFARPRRALQVCMNEFMEQEFRMRWGSVPEIRMPDPTENRFWIELQEVGLLLFLKKFKSGHQISNYQTDTARAFNGQIDLEGVPALPRVTAGYFVTTTGDELAGVHIALLINHAVQWSYEIRRNPSGGTLVVPDYPSLPNVAAPVITLKAGRSRKTGQE